MKRPTKESPHEFTLALAGLSDLTPKVADALYEAGCDDATITVRGGRMFLAFTRPAPSLKDAILSAMRDVRRARTGATVRRVDHRSLVTPAEIARKLGRSRQLVHQYMTGARGPGGFPGPACVVGKGAPQWSWSEVAAWLHGHGLLSADEFRAAEEIDAINAALEWSWRRKSHRKLASDVLRTVGG